MMRRTLVSHSWGLWGLSTTAIGALWLSAMMHAAPAGGSVVEAAMQGNRDAVRALLKDGADVNSAQGDGMTALHWAVVKGDLDLAKILLYAGANVKATTRLGGYTPLLMSARNGNAQMIETLIKGGADPNSATTNGTTTLMLAAASGKADAVTLLIDAGADVNAKEGVKDETALTFAAAYGRADAIRVLTARGADTKAATKVVDLSPFTREEQERLAALFASGAFPGAGGRRSRFEGIPGIERQYLYNELVGTQGGLTPLLIAARQGHLDAGKALLDAGADINQPSVGERVTPLLIATINGHFDLAMFLLAKGADPKLAAANNGATPLYAAINCQWAPKALYPQPRAYEQQQTTHRDLVRALLDKGADPNARLTKKVWYSGYNFDLSGVDEAGATPFWRAAYASDVEAMRLMIAHGADPNIWTMKTPGRVRTGDSQREVKDVSGLPPVPNGAPAVPPLLAAAGVGYGEGFAANSHRFAPGGMLAAVKYLVEELHADVNATDHEGNTALHHAAARGDNEMILYLVSKGANVKAVSREGRTTVDMANGPVQRIQPFPETIALLEKLGAKNNHKCVSC